MQPLGDVCAMARFYQRGGCVPTKHVHQAVGFLWGSASIPRGFAGILANDIRVGSRTLLCQQGAHKPTHRLSSCERGAAVWCDWKPHV